MKIDKNRKWFLVLATLAVVALGVAIYWLMMPKTPGEQFRAAIRKIEKACASRHLAPGEQCGEVAKLKPADPLATPEGRFAHSIKLPEPLPKDSGYRKGMTPREYFDHLCETEAGEFIYRVVEDVDSVYMMRPRKAVTDNELKHLFVLEDPYGNVSGEYRDPREFVQPELGKYQRIELPLPNQTSGESSENFIEFFRDDSRKSDQKHQTARDGRMVFVPYVVSKRQLAARRSQYGFTWRGITRSHDREMGISGGELIVMDLQTNEILAVRRGYIRAASVKNSLSGVWWLTGETCPKLLSRPNRFFLYDVLVPARSRKLRESL